MYLRYTTVRKNGKVHQHWRLMRLYCNRRIGRLLAKNSRAIGTRMVEEK